MLQFAFRLILFSPFSAACLAALTWCASGGAGSMLAADPMMIGQTSGTGASTGPRSATASQPSAWEKFTAALNFGGNKKGKRSYGSGASYKHDPDFDPISIGNGPTAPDAELSIAMAKMTRTDGALKIYDKALKNNPNSLPVLLEYARTLDRDGQFDKAVKLYRTATSKHPESSSAFNDLGLCYFRNGKHSLAATAQRRAVKLRPDRKLYRNNLAATLVKLNQPRAAFEHLTAAHDSATAHYNLGYLLVQEGYGSEALHHFRRSAAIDSRLTVARQWVDKLESSPLPKREAPPQPKHQPKKATTLLGLFGSSAKRPAEKSALSRGASREDAAMPPLPPPKPEFLNPRGTKGIASSKPTKSKTPAKSNRWPVLFPPRRSPATAEESNLAPSPDDIRRKPGANSGFDTLELLPPVKSASRRRRSYQ